MENGTIRTRNILDQDENPVLCREQAPLRSPVGGKPPCDPPYEKGSTRELRPLVLNQESITFGKYKNKLLSDVLKDRNYCIWLSQQDWFQKNYPYLFNRVSTYDPLSFFILPPNQEEPGTTTTLSPLITGEEKDFFQIYKFFNLKNFTEIKLNLNQEEKICYQYYSGMIDKIKEKILWRKKENKDNIYNIKAPTKWLKQFEQETQLKRSVFKEFLSSYELINIPYIIERVKKEGGIEYKGAQSFKIAKARSLEQEAWWEQILSRKYKENISSQFQYKNCIFDFLNISTNIIFECKLSLKDFNESQHKKYKMTLDNYRIIYLIARDCIVDMENKNLLTTLTGKYDKYIKNLDTKKNPTYLDKLIQNFDIVEIEDISTAF